MCMYLYQWLVSFGVCIDIQCFYNVVKNKLQNINIIPELIKRRSTIQEKNMSCECTLNFGQWKTFSENYKPIRILLWFVYKFTKKYCRLQLFSKLIQTQKKYPTSLDKISIITWKLLFISSQIFSCELNLKRTYSLQNISYLLLWL